MKVPSAYRYGVAFGGLVRKGRAGADDYGGEEKSTGNGKTRCGLGRR